MKRQKDKKAAEREREEAETEEEETERIEAEPLTEEDVQKRMAELFKLVDLQGGYGFSETGMELLRANLRIIDDYVCLARIKADIVEAQIRLRIAELNNL